MKLVTFRSNKGLRAGVMVGEYVVDVRKAAVWTNEKESIPETMILLLQAGTAGMEAV